MQSLIKAGLIGGVAGGLAGLPATYLALRLVRKTSNVMLLAPADESKLNDYAARFGVPVGGSEGPAGLRRQGPYL